VELFAAVTNTNLKPMVKEKSTATKGGSFV
jgi:hypothetical protein